MGKLNIAHHKSYHPYRADNIERVRRDEEEARLKEAIEDGRASLAVRTSVSHACLRIRLSS
jgi:predicted methyltransferase MtxX (methanogen marker protein 4)